MNTLVASSAIHSGVTKMCCSNRATVRVKMKTIGLNMILLLLTVLPLLSQWHGVQGQASGTPVLLTPDGNRVTKQMGEIAFLTCKVDNLGIHKLNWIYAKHSTTLFHGDQRLVDDSRYALTHPPESNSYSLQIKSVTHQDQGTYKCEIDGTKQLATVLLGVEGVSNPVIHPEEHLNQTSCCQQQNVSQACLPACEPRSAPNDTDYGQACAADLPHLIYCGSDGRNHEECCAQAGVPAGCLLFCSNDQDKMSNINSMELMCLDFTPRIIFCYEHGGAWSPSHPQSLSVVPVSRNGNYTLLVSWKAPKYNPSTVTGYRVHYKKWGQTKYRVTGILSAADNQYSLSVMANTKYSIYVVAVGNHGSSQPSERVDIAVDKALDPGYATDVLLCCQAHKVSSRCQTALCHSNVWASFNSTAMIDCYQSLPDIFQCLAGERNHTGCCAINNVPDPCLTMCSGNPPPFTKALAMCIPKLSTIEACIQSGLSTQPKAPQKIVIALVTAHTALVAWAAADINASSSEHSYYVQLQRGSEKAPWTTVAKVTGTFYELRNLTETENYAARVIASTVNTSSLPSAVVRFATYPELTAIERPTVAHNFSECCFQSGMPDVCAAGCQYLSNVTTYYASVLVQCIDYIGTVLTCAADGRDHTGCCQRRNVQEECYGLCAFNSPGSLDYSYLKCVPDTSSIIMCYEEGLVDLVRTPEEVVVTNLTTHTLRVQWTTPNTGPQPQEYEVSFRSKDSNITKKRETSDVMYILQDLIPATQYFIWVVSILNGTSSPPSPTITAFTQAQDSSHPFLPYPETNISHALWSNRTHCCQSSGISPQCQPVCLNKPATNAIDCSSENHNILTCAAGGGDHSLCCKENGLAEECVSLCRGQAATNFSIHLTGCLADTSLSIITSCFLSNSGLLPSMPNGFTAQNDYGSKIILKWMPASSCVNADDPCSYDVHFWKSNSNSSLLSPRTTVQNVTSPYNVVDLDRSVHYTFTVTARNSRGSGPAAPWVSLFFGILVPSVSIAQYPKQDIYEQGMTVTLTCDAFNLKEAPRYTWRQRSRILPTRGRILILPDVERTSEGNYSCTMTTQSFTRTASTYVNVRYKPEFNYFRTSSASPGLNQEAVLACWFQGHPYMTNLRQVWTKDGRPIPRKSRYSITAKSRLHTGITPFKLKIANVVASDYGTYTCHVSNQFGAVTAHTKLIDPAKYPAPLPVTPLQKQNVTNCCQAKGVISTCMPLCTFEVSVQQALQQPWTYGGCLIYFKEMIECAADGADHSLCCEKEVVPQLCMPFCRGQVPELHELFHAPHLIQCADESPTILDCMDRGYEKIPTAPRDLVGSFIGNKIKLSWKLPSRHAERVTSYNIYYNFTGNSVLQTVTLTSYVGLKYSLLGMERDHIYHIWMTAENYNFGTSQISNILVISVNGTLPSPPTRLRAVAVTGTTASIAWNEPSAASVPPAAFAVYYRRRNAIKEDMKVTMDMKITLMGLKPRTEYSLYVRSRSISGEGPKSAPITFSTGQKGDTVSQAPSKENQEGEDGLGGGQIAGIVLAVVAVIAVIVVIITLFWRSHVRQPMRTESVAFENPSYGNRVHISGLPENSAVDPIAQAEYQPDLDGNFDYSRLKEDLAPACDSVQSPSEASSPHTEGDTSPADPGSINLGIGSSDVPVPQDTSSEDKNESST